jgi:Secretion system C-terminal sorting domain
MKKIFILLMIMGANAAEAQLTITAGASFNMQAGAQLTLRNSDLVNNGTFVAGSGSVLFNGTAASYIKGTQPIQFFKLDIDKSGAVVFLERPINVIQQVAFTSGFLDLNTYDADLGTTGILNGEKETSRIIGANGGQVLFSTVLNNPVAVNPANLGAIISSSKNLGNVIIRRGHRSQANGFGQGKSTFRYFDIVPANNTALNATLRFRYFDGELNGLNENNLVLWKSLNNSTWVNEGFSIRDAAGNYVEKTGLQSLSRFTLSTSNNALPVLFTLFNVKCAGAKVILNWKTAQEQNSSHFNIERSSDGNNWSVTGSIPAAGNSTNEKSYSFTDHAPLQEGLYRIAQYDLNGSVQFTGTNHVSCDSEDRLKVWPNPFREKVFINISTNSLSRATVRVFDTHGALLKRQDANLSPGSNQVSVDMKNFPAGMYQFAIEWNNGQDKKTVQLVKQ